MAVPALQYSVKRPGDKSVGAAFVLTFFFGNFGIFYVSWIAGVIFIVLGGTAAVLTFGLSLLVTWPAGIVYTCAVASRKHSEFLGWLHRGVLPPSGPDVTVAVGDGVPAGWYADPMGGATSRWWDGQRWL